MRPPIVTRIGPATVGAVVLVGAAAVAGGFVATAARDAARADIADAAPAAAALAMQPPAEQTSRPSSHHAFYFTRAIYSSGYGGWGRRASWATDFPKADLQFLVVLRRLAGIDAYPEEHAITLDDPDLRRYPFLYMLEVGYMSLSPEERKGLRDYLLAGGFLVIDDFWGSQQWASFEHEIRQVLPEYPLEELTIEHPIFSAYYEIDEILQVPSINNIRWGQTHERDGYVPRVLGIHDDDGRLMVLVNWNTDLGDAWEWAEQPDYPLKYSTYAFQIAVNFIIYALSH